VNQIELMVPLGLLLVASVCTAVTPRPMAQPIVRPAPPPARPLPLPVPPGPSGFTAQHLGNGTVNLNWQASIGASAYHLDGAGIAPPGLDLAATATSFTLTAVPAGIDAWHLTALYGSTLGTAAIASAIVRILPAHPIPWLSKNNGPGDATTNAVHYMQFCAGFQAGVDCFTPLTSLASAGWLWGDIQDNAQNGEAVYGNVGDLGFGRRTNCITQFNGPPLVPGIYTVCYATNHGTGPGQPGFASAAVITRAAAGEDPPPTGSPPCSAGPRASPCTKNPWGSLPRTASVIIKGPLGFQFMSMSLGQPMLAFDPGAQNYGPLWYSLPVLLPAVVMDTEGPKRPPHACLSCHGGNYDTASGRVQGATLLPLDPALLAFGTTQPGDRTQYERPYQEENIRRINSTVLASGPAPAVADYINGLYPAGVAQAKATSQANYVPPGWADQSGLYLSIVKPYCASCHWSAPANINFATSANFLQNRALIYSAVCQQKTMPHAEIPFRNFWTKDTGAYYLPGLLATALGYQSCP
jgi:hypothetical protein